MESTRQFLRSLGLPARDAHDLPSSEKRFPDGAQYRVEIPSVEGPEALAAVFAERPALHRYPKSMAARTQALAQLIVDRYDGDAGRVWKDASDGADLRRRVAELPGFGAQKAQIFVALLGKQLGVQPAGWREAAGSFGEPGSYCSVADICDEDSLAQVRAYKQELKAAAKAKAGTKTTRSKDAPVR